MKKIAIFSLAVFFLMVSNALALDYNGALKAAKQQNKPVLLYFFNESCRYCTMMDKNTLADKDVDAILKKDFVFLRVDTEKNADLSMLYRIQGTPSSWFIEPSGKRIFQTPGYVAKNDYVILLDYIKGKHYVDTDFQAFYKARSKK